MRRLNRLAILVALVCAAFALAVAGCGGGDDSSSTTAGPTKEEFITQADAICQSSNDAVDAQAQQVFGGQQPTDAQVLQFVKDTLIPSAEEEISAIEALTPPEGDEEEVQAITDAVRSAIEEVKANPETAAAGGEASPFNEANQLGKAYGLKVCGQS